MNRSSNVRRRAQQLRRERAREQGDGSTATLRLLVCGVIFVLLVAAKLLFPEAVSGVTRSAGQLIGRNADFKEAFAAMGRAISGEEPAAASLQDAYTAVFNPAPPDTGSSAAPPDSPPDSQPDAAAVQRDQAARVPSASQASQASQTPPASPASQTAQVPQAPPASSALTALDLGGLAPQTLPQPPEEVLDAVTETVVEDPGQSAPEPDDTTASEALSYVYTMPALPENASLEQRNLGFVHCTPVSGVLSSTFGWREHPVEGGSKFHYGVDLAAEEGAPVLAFADGSVYATGESSTLGNYIMLQHAGGYITLYAHCSRVTASGGSVAMGDKIAEVGATGLATGPHLHFELHDGGLYLNPIFYVDVG